MNWVVNARLSLRSLARVRGRTLLAAGSMALGIAAMVVLVGLGAGAERALTSAMEKSGKN